LNQTDAIAGCLLGTAVGDALGLPYEGLSPRRGQKLFGDPTRYHLLFGRGMVSDDTEHTCMTAQAILCARGDVDRFRADLARRLRWWLLGAPAGVGLATLKSIVKLWMGFPPSRSGVWSAGNGPAMRAAIIGVLSENLRQLADFTEASCRITHRDPKAIRGALAVALASYLGSRDATVGGKEYVEQLTELLQDDNDAGEFLSLIYKATASAADGATTVEFARSCGFHRGVSGYIYHTVPVTIHAWIRYRERFSDAVSQVIRCGGDADTTGAITGGLMGAALGQAAIPSTLVSGLFEWPHAVAWMHELARSLASTAENARKPFHPALSTARSLPRNALFGGVVIAQALRRLVPPY
jgi:ADP-ribosylglycohydrolase